MLDDDERHIDDEEENEEQELINLFTESVINKHGNYLFFDSDDLLVVIDHFIQCDNVEYARCAVNYAYDFFPNDGDIILKNAQVSLIEGDLNKAFRLLREAKDNCNEVEYYYTLGQYYALCNKHNDSIKAYTKALTITSDPIDECNINYGIASQLMAEMLYDKAIEHFKKAAVNAEPVHREIIFLDIRHCYQYTNKLNEAIRYFTEYIDKEPNCIAAWNSLADCYRILDKYDEAIEYYEFALSINPIDAYANINIANLYYDDEKYEEALETINEALSNGLPENNDIDTIMADCLYNINKLDEAENLYKRALRFNHDDTNAWSGLGFIYSDSHCYDKAIVCLNNGIGIINDENTLEVMLTLADAYINTGDYDKAIDTLQKVIKEWETEPIAYCMLAKIHIADGNFMEASEILEKGLDKTNYNSNVIYTMAYYHLFVNNRSMGLLFLERALQEDFDSYYKDFIDINPELLSNDAEVLELINTYREKNDY